MKKQQRCVKTVSKSKTSKSLNYSRWSHMRRRCNLKTSEEYFRYGAKGVSVHSEWVKDFFSYDRYIMSLPNALKKGYTIDRIDSYGNYQPGNLRWASTTTQSRNCKMASNNKSGVTGVSWDRVNNKWRASITVNYRSVCLGRYLDLEEAVNARIKAEVKYEFFKDVAVTKQRALNELKD